MERRQKRQHWREKKKDKKGGVEGGRDCDSVELKKKVKEEKRMRMLMGKIQ